jgi:DNA-binding transcriptional MerR regulator
MYLTVNDVAELAGVSARTIRFYDEIGLFKPTSVNIRTGYRHYEKEAMLRLQQILFFREMDFSLKEIKELMERPDYDQLEMMKAHRAALQKRVGRLNKLIRTLDQTILHLNGEINMTTHDLFSGFDKETQEAYAEEAARRWDADTVRAANRRWNKLSEQQKTAVMSEASEIHQGLLTNMDKGHDSDEIQALVGRWYIHLHHYFEPSLEIFRGVGQGYEEDPAFAAFYEKLHPNMPTFFRQAIEYYCDVQEGNS